MALSFKGKPSGTNCCLVLRPISPLKCPFSISSHVTKVIALQALWWSAANSRAWLVARRMLRMCRAWRRVPCCGAEAAIIRGVLHIREGYDCACGASRCQVSAARVICAKSTGHLSGCSDLARAEATGGLRAVASSRLACLPLPLVLKIVPSRKVETPSQFGRLFLNHVDAVVCVCVCVCVWVGWWYRRTVSVFPPMRCSCCCAPG